MIKDVYWPFAAQNQYPYSSLSPQYISYDTDKENLSINQSFLVGDHFL